MNYARNMERTSFSTATQNNFLHAGWAGTLTPGPCSPAVEVLRLDFYTSERLTIV